jgi:hypothetical protein
MTTTTTTPATMRGTTTPTATNAPFGLDAIDIGAEFDQETGLAHTLTSGEDDIINALRDGQWPALPYSTPEDRAEAMADDDENTDAEMDRIRDGFRQTRAVYVAKLRALLEMPEA